MPNRLRFSAVKSRIARIPEAGTGEGCVPGAINWRLHQRSGAAQQSECAAISGDAQTHHSARKAPMEFAAIVLFSSVVLWFVEEATDDHI
jgi:hypothetical protein